MPESESLEAFYSHKFEQDPPPPEGAGDFNVFNLTGSRSGTPAQYLRHDFYKIMLISGKHRCHYADKSITLDGNTLLFFNPAVLYRFERLDQESTGFFCVFKEPFYTWILRSGIQDLHLFSPGGSPAYELNQKQVKQVTALFKKMLAEVGSDYRFKYDLLRNHVTELIHFTMKLEPAERLYSHPDTNARITSIFTNLLECQFPVESPGQSIRMRSAGDFADKLGLHVNHLNRAIRLTTGKTTSAHIAERVAAEAMALLKHTKWNVSEISYSLGFAQPSHFAHFFKKQTKVTPTAVRFA